MVRSPVLCDQMSLDYCDPAVIPALVKRARRPGAFEPWVQPPYAHDAYKLLDPFTGQAEVCAYGGKNWRTNVDNNVWEPGTYGWDLQG